MVQIGWLHEYFYHHFAFSQTGSPNSWIVNFTLLAFAKRLLSSLVVPYFVAFRPKSLAECVLKLDNRRDPHHLKVDLVNTANKIKFDYLFVNSCHPFHYFWCLPDAHENFLQLHVADNQLQFLAWCVEFESENNSIA